MRGTGGVTVAFFAGALAGCAAADAEKRCVPPLQSAPVIELFFGRGLPGGGEVREAEWQSFLDAEVTPRFPAGLTVFDARGQWRDGVDTRHENSKVLLILPLGVADREAALAAVMDTYRVRFRQSSVLRLDLQGCFALHQE